MEVESSGVDLADSGGTSVASVAIAVGANRVVGDGVDAAAEGIPVDAANVAAEEGDADGVKVEEASGTGKEMQQEVAARLKTLLAHIDPSFRDVFISMLKVRSFNIQIYSMESNMFIFLEMGLSFLDFSWYCI
ncbi:unnamed protein product [Urochloa humidicola]